MKKTTIIWVVVAAVIAIVMIRLNTQNKEEGVPLNQIFPDDEVQPVAMEYANEEKAPQQPQPQVVAAAVPVPTKSVEPKQAPAPVKPVVTPTVAPKKKVTVATLKVASKLSKVPSTTAAKKSKRSYAIQVASYKEKSMADRDIKILKQKGYAGGYLLIKDLGKKGKWYRVCLGKYSDKPKAEKSLKDIQKHFQKSFIISVQ
ncbi:MAG: SPOR domain-containing protein [Candidatus Omnitrophica bacterium]|nr:SPOR domain-containing protein [Candidatus Omnitrophota bacterium]